MRLTGKKSITFRLTLLFASASTGVLLLLGLLIGISVEQHFEEQDMELLTGKLELISHALENVHSRRDFDAIPQQLENALIGHPGLEVLVLSPEGQTLFKTSGAEFPQALLDSHQQSGPIRPTVWKNRESQLLRGVAVSVHTGLQDKSPAIVAVATDTAHHEHFMSAFQIKLWSVVVLAALLTGFLGWISARRGLAPLRGIKQGAAGVTAQRLDYRLSLDSVPIELVALAETLNDMLSRLEDSFRRLSDFSSDIAHELRTPVSNLLTQTQVTLSKARTSDEYRDILASNVEEFERLSRMITDMLFLAKAENLQIIPNREQLELANEVADLLEFYEVLADEKKIRLSLVGHGTVSGDRLMLRRAISNLLSNALRYTPAGGEVTARIEMQENGGIKVVIENTGPCISAEHLPRLFDRFYRADSARHRTTEGSGLGLAITRSILNAHGGEVSVSSAKGVTAFTLSLPEGAKSCPI